MESPEHYVDMSNEKSAEEKENILGSNLGALCDIFNTNNRIGDYSALKEHADTIETIIKEHFDEQERNVRQPYSFLKKVREAEQNALSSTQDSARQAEIKALFKHVDMPGLELPEQL